MKDNPEKCQYITYNETKGYEMEGHIIECSEYIKLLGLTEDTQLQFDKHEQLIYQNPQKHVTALMIISKLRNERSKLASYNTFFHIKC